MLEKPDNKKAKKKEMDKAVKRSYGESLTADECYTRLIQDMNERKKPNRKNKKDPKKTKQEKGSKGKGKAAASRKSSKKGKATEVEVEKDDESDYDSHESDFCSHEDDYVYCATCAILLDEKVFQFSVTFVTSSTA